MGGIAPLLGSENGKTRSQKWQAMQYVITDGLAQLWDHKMVQLGPEKTNHTMCGDKNE